MNYSRILVNYFRIRQHGEEQSSRGQELLISELSIISMGLNDHSMIPSISLESSFCENFLFNANIATDTHWRLYLQQFSW